MCASGLPPGGRTGSWCRSASPTGSSGSGSTGDGEALKADVESRSSEALARRIAAVALDKKARDVVVLDMRDVVAYTDFLVIATGNTERQTQAIQDAIHHDLKHADGGRDACPERVEGAAEARWILMDYLDCVVHVFTPAARDYYRLETLWGEVPELEVEQTA